MTGDCCNTTAGTYDCRTCHGEHNGAQAATQGAPSHNSYSASLLAAMENDGVVSKALERYPNVCVVMPKHPNYYPASLADQHVSLQETFSPEATKHGVLLMPDLCGHGPIYVSVLEKRESQPQETGCNPANAGPGQEQTDED
eukprot:1161519-Pelagomonas_calceolata.AAC.2